MYQNKLQEQGIQDVVNTNRIKFQPYGDLVDQIYSKFNETLINNQDPQAKLKMTKHQGQNILMKFIQKTEKQTKPQQLPVLCQKYYQVMTSQKV